MITHCPSCGEGVAAGETICMECGTELVLVTGAGAEAAQSAQSAQSAQPAQQVVAGEAAGARECPDCFSSVVPDRNGFCSICGHDFSEDVPDVSETFDERTFFTEPPSLDQLRMAEMRPGAHSVSPPPASPVAPASPLPLPSDRVRTRFQGSSSPTIDPGPAASVAAAARLDVEGGQTVFFDGEMTSSVPLDVDQVLIGRRDPAAGHYPEVDLTHLAQLDPHISRRHARIVRTRAGFFVEDLCSNDATFLNDRAHALNGERHELHDGDRVLISDAIAMRFRIDGGR
jgi:predicted component of type VI protein secretion system